MHNPDTTQNQLHEKVNDSLDEAIDSLKGMPPSKFKAWESRVRLRNMLKIVEKRLAKSEFSEVELTIIHSRAVADGFLSVDNEDIRTWIVLKRLLGVF